MTKRTHSTCFWGIAVFSIPVIVGCGLSQTEDLAADQSEPMATFNQLARGGDGTEGGAASGEDDSSSASRDGDLDSSATLGTDSTHVTPSSPAQMSETTTRVGAEVHVDVVSACHYGELEMLKARVLRESTLAACSRPWNESKTQTAASAPDYSRAKIVLESETGEILASRALLPQELIDAAKGSTSGTKTTFTRDLALSIPNRLMAPGTTFRASLFVCSDSDDDGACSDEPVQGMPSTPVEEQTCNSALSTPSVVYYALYAISVGAEGTLTFSPVDTSAAAAPQDSLQAAAQAMDGMLRNVASADTPSAVGPSITLVGQASAASCQPAPRTDGCFVEGTLIEVGRGRTLPVEQLMPGSFVSTVDGRLALVERVVAGPETVPVVAIATATGEHVTVTQSHPMMTTSGIKRAGELSFDDALIARDGSATAIQSLSSLDYTGKVWNFALAGSTHLVFAAGLATGDLATQIELARPPVVASR